MRQSQRNTPRFHFRIQQLERRYLNSAQSGGDTAGKDKAIRRRVAVVKIATSNWFNWDVFQSSSNDDKIRCYLTHEWSQHKLVAIIVIYNGRNYHRPLPFALKVFNGSDFRTVTFLPFPFIRFCIRAFRILLSVAFRRPTNPISCPAIPCLPLLGIR